MTISLLPSTANALSSSLLNSPATNSSGDNMAFNNQLQKEISSLREPNDKTAKTRSAIDKETEQDPSAATVTDIPPELTQQNLLTLIMNVRPSLSPLDVPQANPDTATGQPDSTVKPAISGALNGTVKQPVKETTTTQESLSASHQYMNATPTPVASSPMDPTSSVKPKISGALNGTVKQPEKETTITPESLSAARQSTDVIPTPAASSPMEPASPVKTKTSSALNEIVKPPVKGTVVQLESLSASRQSTDVIPTPAASSPIEPERPANINRPEEFFNSLQNQSSLVNVAVTHPSTDVITSAPASATYNISPALDSPNWDQAISQRIVWMVQNKLQTASLTVNPAHLGPVQVLMQIDNQQATVQFVSAQAEVREALQNALPLLTDMLKQSGIQLGHADVSSHNKNSDSRQSPNSNQSKTNRNSIETSTAEPVIDTRHATGTGQGLINLIV
jgi:flagellar hook-length control protein FliK